MSTTDPYEIIATLDTAIKRVTEELEAHPVDSAEHKETVKQLQSCGKLRMKRGEQAKKRPACDAQRP